MCISAFICRWCGQEWVCNATKSQLEAGIRHKDGPCCCGSFCDCDEAQKVAEQLRNISVMKNTLNLPAGTGVSIYS